VLLVAHGSRDPRAAATVTGLVAAVRVRLPRARVEVAYLDFTAPSVGAALAALADGGVREVTVVPLLFAPGYHLRVDLPSAVAEVRAAREWLSVSIAEPLGTDPEPGSADLLVDALSLRLRETGRGYDALVLASAGSSDEGARSVVAQVAARLARPAGRPVVPAYATAAGPTVEEAVARLHDQGYARVAVSGLFIAPGRLPEAVRRSAEIAGAAVVAEPLGVRPELVELIAQRTAVARPADRPLVSA
jgi:sirohydrochlorin ferrochelatase